MTVGPLQVDLRVHIPWGRVKALFLLVRVLASLGLARAAGWMAVTALMTTRYSVDGRPMGPMFQDRRATAQMLQAAFDSLSSSPSDGVLWPGTAVKGEEEGKR